jgi:hypothetical protein
MIDGIIHSDEVIQQPKVQEPPVSLADEILKRMADAENQDEELLA